MANKKDATDKVVKKKTKKKISALVVDDLQHSAVGHVRTDSSSDASGSSGLNSGPVVSYKREK